MSMTPSIKPNKFEIILRALRRTAIEQGFQIEAILSTQEGYEAYMQESEFRLQEIRELDKDIKFSNITFEGHAWEFIEGDGICFGIKIKPF